MRKTALVAIVATFSLAACGEPSLRELRSPSEGPDEFRIVPALPLQQPESYTVLPEPTPGGANRVDRQPIADVAQSLGGRAGSPNAPVPGADAGLVSYASRSGVDPNIRARLNREDTAFRKRQARFANIKIFPEDRYDEAYKRQTLDAFKTANQFRRAGIPVPSAPPARGR
jgi:hypothetical protein